MAALAQVSALEARLGLAAGTLADGDLARATAALEDVSDLVRAEGRATWAEADVPPAVRVVVLKAAKRTYDNPEGLKSENLGEYGTSRGDTSAYLTGDERKIIRRAAKVGGPVSVRTPSAYNPTGSTSTTYVPAEGGSPIPWGEA